VKNKLITVITVVRNGEDVLEKTIQSIISQTCRNFEYIIIDGMSNDRTIDIIKKYDYAIDHWISESDFGPYDAMNKGINLANGRWINFMNCGDEFSSADVLSKIFNSKKLSNFDVIYGNHKVMYPHMKKKNVKPGNLNNLWQGSKFCHQASFTSASILKHRMFNLQFRFASDFHLFYNVWMGGAKFKYFDFCVASISSGGISDKNRMQVLWEWLLIVEKSPKTYLYYFIEALSQISRLIIKSLTRFPYLTIKSKLWLC
jgi:glycosyltransferase involved in cell wall biosynthesis